MRILQVVNDMHRAGLETMLMNYYRKIDRNTIQFDFLTHRPEKSDYDDEIIGMGGKMYYAPRLYPYNYPAYFRYMKTFFENHPEYKIIHSHIDAMSYLPLLAAKKANIPIRIAHSHNTSIDKDYKYILKQIFKSKIKDVANYYCACGDEAGKFLFGDKEFTVIPNAIEANKFVYDTKIREKKQKEFKINGIVIGHVGRLSYQKNHKFLIDIFREICKLRNDATLILIGCGEKENEIRQQVKEYNLSNKVLFLGKRDNVYEFYQMMDAFVMPSFFEGVPVTGIEAQFSGIPCFFSDKVPKEVDFTGNCTFLSLNESGKKWAMEILKKCKNLNRLEESSCAKNSIYNIENSHYYLEKYYRSFDV